METLNRNHISYKEMDELIGLAEKVSENIDTLKGKIKVKKAYMLLYFVLPLWIVLLIILGILGQFFNTIFSSIMPEIAVKLLGGITVVAFFAQTLLKFQELIKIKITINKEEKVLQKLLNMIEGYKDLYAEDEYGHNSPILLKALFEMRLSRISFGVK